MNLKVGDRVMVPRSSGRQTPGRIISIFPNSGWARIVLDQKGRRGQDIGKVLPLDELRKI